MLPYINDFPIEFRDYIASEIIPRYAGFDKAHRVDHVLKVIAESLNLSQYYGCEPHDGVCYCLLP